MIIANTIVVLTTMPERRDEWRGMLEDDLQEAQQQGPDWQIEIELYTVLLALLDGQAAVLPADHAYASVLIEIQEGIAAGGLMEEEGEEEETEEEDLFALLINNTLAVLGPAQERLHEWREVLVQMRGQASEGGELDLVALYDAIIGLLDAGGNPAGLGGGLTGEYARVWQEIVGRLPVEGEE